MNQSSNSSGPPAANLSRMGLAAFLFSGVLILTVFFLPASSAYSGSVPGEVACRVVFVDDDDTLNVRSEPGSKSPAVGALPPGATGVRITGGKRMVGNDAWFFISAKDFQGWVSGRYLTEDITPESFCQSPTRQTPGQPAGGSSRQEWFFIGLPGPRGTRPAPPCRLSEQGRANHPTGHQHPIQ